MENVVPQNIALTHSTGWYPDICHAKRAISRNYWNQKNFSLDV